MDARKTMGDESSERKVGTSSPKDAWTLTDFAGMKFSWLTIAEKEMGVKEIAGADDNPRVLEYHATTTLRATDDSVPWCSSFVNWCMQQAGYKGTNSARALSWQEWGSECIDFVPNGSVVVMRRKGGGHVGFKVGQDVFYTYVLGGNQGDEVNIRKFANSQIVAYRMPLELDDQDDVVYQFISRHEV